MDLINEDEINNQIAKVKDNLYTDHLVEVTIENEYKPAAKVGKVSNEAEFDAEIILRIYRDLNDIKLLLRLKRTYRQLIGQRPIDEEKESASND